MSFLLTSTAFEEGQSIPVDYTADGRNVSPPLKWTDPPVGTQTFALICEDPDARRGVFTHWVIFNIPAMARELSENIVHKEGFANGEIQGISDFGKIGYGGPAPPSGTHRYFFKLFALNRTLSLHGGATKDELLKAMEGHILGQAQLMGTYSRDKR